MRGQGNHTAVHSIFTSDSCSSGRQNNVTPGGAAMLQMPQGFQAHNLTDHQEVISHGGPAAGSGGSNLLIFGQG